MSAFAYLQKDYDKIQQKKKLETDLVKNLNKPNSNKKRKREDHVSSVYGPFRSRPIRAQQKFSRPIRIEYLGQVTNMTSQLPIFGHGNPRDPME